VSHRRGRRLDKKYTDDIEEGRGVYPPKKLWCDFPPSPGSPKGPHSIYTVIHDPEIMLDVMTHDDDASRS